MGTYKDLVKLVRRADWKKVFKENEGFYLEMLDEYRKSIFDLGQECLYNYASDALNKYKGDFEKSWEDTPSTDYNYAIIGDRNMFISMTAYDRWFNTVLFFNFKESPYIRLPLNVCEYLNGVFHDIVKRHASDDYRKFFQLED